MSCFFPFATYITPIYTHNYCMYIYIYIKILKYIISKSVLIGSKGFHMVSHCKTMRNLFCKSNNDLRNQVSYTLTFGKENS